MELFNNGEKPFPEISNLGILNALKQGKRPRLKMKFKQDVEIKSIINFMFYGIKLRPSIDQINLKFKKQIKRMDEETSI